jgi:hypothetical protein
VQFISSGSDDKIEFNKNVTFAGDVKLYDAVEFNGGGMYYKGITGVDFNTIDRSLSPGGNDASYKISGNTVTKPTSGSFSVDVVVSGENVTVTGRPKFEKNATFEGNVTFTEAPTFGTAAQAAVGGNTTPTTTVINGLAVFENGADFGGTVTEIKPGSKPIGNTVIIEEVEFQKGNFKNITDLKLGNSTSPAVEFWTGDVATDSVGSGSITLLEGEGITFKENTLTFTGKGGTLGAAIALNNVTVELEKGANMNFNQGGQLPITIMQAGDTGGGFEIIGKAKLDGGVIKGEGSGVVVKAGDGIILTVPGAPPVPTNMADIAVDNATLDLSSGGAIVFAGTASRIRLTNSANIKLSDDPDGLAIPKGQSFSVVAIMAGNSGGSAALLTGSESLPSGQYVGTVSGGTYVVGSLSSESGISNMLNNTNRFILVGTKGAAGSLIVGPPPGTDKFSTTTGGSFVAVFTLGDGINNANGSLE